MNSRDINWGGLCLTLEEAQQECQVVAADDLRRDVIDEGIWVARDSVNGALYHIERLAL